MGTWGINTFQNDAAVDWLYKLEKSKGTALLGETLKAVTDSDEDYIKVDECHRALAAAEVIAALRGNPRPNLPPEVVEWVQAHPTRPASHRAHQNRHRAERAMGRR